MTTDVTTLTTKKVYPDTPTAYIITTLDDTDTQVEIPLGEISSVTINYDDKVKISNVDKEEIKALRSFYRR